jgi:serine/threonine protein kinase
MFAAPEQLRNRPADARSDVYALAGSLYYCLAFDRPQLREPDNFEGNVVPANLRDLLRRALDPKPDGRHPDAAAFVRALEAIDEAEAVPVLTPAPTGRPSTTSGSSRQPASQPGVGDRRRPENRVTRSVNVVPWVLGGVIGAVVLFLGAVVLVSALWIASSRTSSGGSSKTVSSSAESEMNRLCGSWQGSIVQRSTGVVWTATITFASDGTYTATSHDPYGNQLFDNGTYTYRNGVLTLQSNPTRTTLKQSITWANGNQFRAQAVESPDTASIGASVVYTRVN